MSAVAQKQLIESDPKARFRNAPRKPDFTIGQEWGRYTRRTRPLGSAVQALASDFAQSCLRRIRRNDREA
jgi:hypothetical protein